MRRLAFLLVLPVAVILAFTLLRPRPVRIERRVATPSTTSSPTPSMSDDAEVHELEPPEAASSPVPSPLPRGVPPVPVPKGAGRKYWITVVDSDAKPVEDAVVFFVMQWSGMPSEQTKVDERRTSAEGRTENRIGDRDRADVLAYKSGVGAGALVSVQPKVDVTLKFEKALTLKVACQGPFGLPLENAEVVLTMEVIYERRDPTSGAPPVVLPLPPRMLTTDSEGRCAFGGVLPPGRIKHRWGAGPGIRHRLKAEWNRTTATELIEKVPDGALLLFLQ